MVVIRLGNYNVCVFRYRDKEENKDKVVQKNVSQGCN